MQTNPRARASDFDPATALSPGADGPWAPQPVAAEPTQRTAPPTQVGSESMSEAEFDETLGGLIHEFTQLPKVEHDLRSINIDQGTARPAREPEAAPPAKKGKLALLLVSCTLAGAGAAVALVLTFGAGWFGNKADDGNVAAAAAALAKKATTDTPADETKAEPKAADVAKAADDTSEDDAAGKGAPKVTSLAKADGDSAANTEDKAGAADDDADNVDEKKADDGAAKADATKALAAAKAGKLAKAKAAKAAKLAKAKAASKRRARKARRARRKVAKRSTRRKRRRAKRARRAKRRKSSKDSLDNWEDPFK